ncbi:hypothetical protein TNCV_2128141 [Trichonephila clavipes]|nr:hypothetical protein TNCV_2128141 [Trichonephila clavipes]
MDFEVLEHKSIEDISIQHPIQDEKSRETSPETWKRSLVVRASDSRPEGLGSMPDATKHPPSTHGFTCRHCGDRGRVDVYRPFGEFRRAKIVLSPVWCSRPTTGVPLAHATMNFVGLDLTTSDRWY